MDLHYKQEVTVGALVLAAIVIFVAGAVWLSGRSLGSGGNLTRVEFERVGNLKEGVPVLISGVNKGKVSQIRLIQPGQVAVFLELDKDVRLQADARAQIVSISALGDAAVSLDPGQAGQPLGKDQVIRGTTEPSLTDRFAALGDKADTVLLGARELVSRRTADDLHATMVAMQRMLNTVSDRLPAPTQEATRTMAAIRQLSARLDSTLANPGLNRGLGNLDSVTANLSRMTEQLTRTTARLDTLLGGITDGRGSLGLMATDTTLYHNLTTLLASMRQLVDDIQRNPGRITVQLKVF